MTPAVSAAHLERLGATMQRAGILDSAGAITDARRILNSDECPNPWAWRAPATVMVIRCRAGHVDCENPWELRDAPGTVGMWKARGELFRVLCRRPELLQSLCVEVR